MKHVHLPFEELLKLKDGVNRLASEFLTKQALRPEPAWYADLLEEHQAEIAAVVLLWFMEVQDALSAVDWVEWTDPFLWIALEERLARLLAPRLREAARASVRRLAIEEDEPVPLRTADVEIAMWAGSEAARQAQLIAAETRMAVIESVMSLDEAGATDSGTMNVLLGAGAFGLTRRFAGAALRPVLSDGTEGLEAAVMNARRLLDVRQQMIGETNTVAAIARGFLVAGLLWETDGKLVTKTYFTQADERVCPRCGPLHGQEVPLRGMFSVGGDFVEAPPIHPLCRCFVRVSVRPADLPGTFL